MASGTSASVTVRLLNPVTPVTAALAPSTQVMFESSQSVGFAASVRVTVSEVARIWLPDLAQLGTAPGAVGAQRGQQVPRVGLPGDPARLLVEVKPKSGIEDGAVTPLPHRCHLLDKLQSTHLRQRPRGSP